MDDAVVLPIYYTTQPYIAQPYVKNYRWSILGTIDFKEAYIENSPENPPKINLISKTIIYLNIMVFSFIFSIKSKHLIDSYLFKCYSNN